MFHKILLLKILVNFQEDIYAGVISLLKVQAGSLPLYLEKKTPALMLSWKFCEIFTKTTASAIQTELRSSAKT